MTPKSSVLLPLAHNVVWPALLVVAAIGGSWVLACVTPFAAFAAILAESERRGAALATMASIWLVNQAVGVMVLGYPLNLHSIGWGVAIGVAALLATFVASAVTRLALQRGVRLVLAFAAAFIIYEAALASVAAATGELAGFAPAIVAQLAMLEAAWLVALVALHEVLAFVGWRPSDWRLAA